MANDESQKQKRSNRGSKDYTGIKVHVASLMDLCHLKNSELEASISKVQRQSRAPQVTLWRMILVMQHSQNKDHQHHKWQPQKSWILFQDYQDVQDKQQTQYPLTPRSKWKMLHRYWKFQSQNVQMFGYVYQNTNGPSHGPVWKIQSILLGEICTCHPLAGLLWERQFEKVLLEHGWEKNSKLGMSLCTSWKRIILIRVCGWHKNWLERSKISIRCGKYSIKKSNCENQHHSLIMYTWDVLKENVKLARILWIITEECSNQGFWLGPWKNYQKQEPHGNLTPKTIHSWSYDMEGHAQKCVEWYCELANKTIEQFFKVATPCMDDHQFKEEENGSVGELSTVCSQIVLKCLYVARIGRCGILCSVNKLARAVTKWTKACDNLLARFISYIHHTCEYR